MFIASCLIKTQPDILYGIEEGLGNKRCVVPMIQGSFPNKVAVINRVLENPFDLASSQGSLGSFSPQSLLIGDIF